MAVDNPEEYRLSPMHPGHIFQKGERQYLVMKDAGISDGAQQEVIRQELESIDVGVFLEVRTDRDQGLCLKLRGGNLPFNT